MLDDRKAAILQAVVEEYIQTAQPVGSSHVSRHPGLAVSSATVRNEMGVLEREGYLVQPHTSAGRIPTDKGYRFFVDRLVGPGHLGPAQTQQVREFFAHAHGELERMLADTSRLLSGLTDYAAVIVRPLGEVTHVRSVQVVGLGPRSALVVAVVSSGSIVKRSLELTEDFTVEQLALSSSILSRAADGQIWGAEIAIPPSGDPAVDRLLAGVVASLGVRESEPAQVFVGGAARMAPAFDAVTTIREVLGILEQQYVVVSLLRDVLDRGLTVAIGTEHGVSSLADCSIVVAPYQVEGEDVGTVGILGPTRMHYDQALAAVAVVSKRLSRALSEGA